MVKRCPVRDSQNTAFLSARGPLNVHTHCFGPRTAKKGEKGTYGGIQPQATRDSEVSQKVAASKLRAKPTNENEPSKPSAYSNMISLGR